MMAQEWKMPLMLRLPPLRYDHSPTACRPAGAKSFSKGPAVRDSVGNDGAQIADAPDAVLRQALSCMYDWVYGIEPVG